MVLGAAYYCGVSRDHASRQASCWCPPRLLVGDYLAQSHFVLPVCFSWSLAWLFYPLIPKGIEPGGSVRTHTQSFIGLRGTMAAGAFSLPSRSGDRFCWDATVHIFRAHFCNPYS